MRRTDFRFDLPQSLIAQRPLDSRSASRLLVLAGDSIRHCQFDDLGDLLGPDDLLIVNDSRVIKARLMAQKDSGGRAEMLVERILDTNRALCQVRVSKPLKPNRCLYLDGHRIDVVKRDGEFYLLDFNAPVAEYLDAHGEVPLPPYIERPPHGGGRGPVPDRLRCGAGCRGRAHGGFALRRGPLGTFACQGCAYRVGHPARRRRYLSAGSG